MTDEQEETLRQALSYCIDVYDNEEATNRIIQFIKDDQPLQLLQTDVMQRCINFYNWADSKYAYNLKGKFYKNTYQLEYGEGISHEAAYLEFCNENVA